MAQHPQPDQTSPAPAAANGGRALVNLPRNVRVLGLVALCNDAASEAAYWLLPQFLVSVLGAGTMAFGLIEGAAESASSFIRLFSGFFSDRLRRRKPLAAAGYTLANLAKPLLAISTSWQQVFWIRLADRGSKGLRAPARDALIADSVSAGRRGAAFGFHQAMDTAGAILGPLSAALLVLGLQAKARTVFWLAGIPGLATILLAWFAVREIRPPEHTTLPKSESRAASGGSARAAAGLGEHRGRLTLMFVALGVFALGNSSDLFLVLRAENLGVRAAFAPLLGLVFNAVYTSLSWPLGSLSDRAPRRWLVVAGYFVYAAVYLAFALARHAWMAWAAFPVYGLYYALTESVTRAWIADLAPERARASAYGIFNWVTAAGALPASLLAGWLWRAYTPGVPFAAGAALAALAAVLLIFV
ncbi:MAG TPA: MFS transporter [Terriglobia bacterium]|nr:MFS transporter [Terriglobia bacterium]